MTDRYAWALDTARAVRERNFGQIDTDALAEELEQMGRSDRRELKTRIQRIIEHLVKVRYIGGLDVPHWNAEIIGFRQEIESLLEESPSLQAQVTPELLTQSYNKALKRLATEYPWFDAPNSCPFRLDEVLPEEE